MGFFSLIVLCGLIGLIQALHPDRMIKQALASRIDDFNSAWERDHGGKDIGEYLKSLKNAVQSGSDKEIDLGDIKITINDTHLCVKYFVFDACIELPTSIPTLICGTKLGPVTIGCASDEENYLGLCYQKCSILANANYPLRTATNTCAKNGCGPDEDLDAGLCYPKCKDHYMGVGPVCWGYCSHFCGSDYDDLGLYCYRWWPPHACNKPSYGRGVGTAPYSPWTKGVGCNGFGVNNEGGCAKIDISGMISLEC